MWRRVINAWVIVCLLLTMACQVCVAVEGEGGGEDGENQQYLTMTGETGIIETRNPTFQELLDAETVEQLELLLYPHMPNFPLKYFDMACFNCTDSEIMVSSETIAFLTGYYPRYDDDIGYTNAEVLSVQIFVALAFMRGEDYNTFANEVIDYGYSVDEWNFITEIMDFKKLQGMLSSCKSYLSEEDGYTGALNREGTPYSLGIANYVDQDVETRDGIALRDYWEGYIERLAEWGLEIVYFERTNPLNPYVLQENLGLYYPGKPSETEIAPGGEEEIPGDSDTISQEEVGQPAVADPTFEGDHWTGEVYKPEVPNGYVDSVESTVDTSTEEAVTKLSGRYGLQDYLLYLSVAVVIVCAIVFGIQDYIQKRRDPLRNYPRWR